MTTGPAFRSHIRQMLDASPQVLLRIAASARRDEIFEFSGRRLLTESDRLVDNLAAPATAAPTLLLLPHSPELFLLQIGLVLNDRRPAILPWPTSRIDAAKYQRNLLGQLRRLPANQLVTVPELAETFAKYLPYPTTPCVVTTGLRYEFERALVFNGAELAHPACAARAECPSDALFLQFSGGTTGVQKAVLVTASMLVEQLERLAKALAFTASDGVVSWLPLYHDMGLIACLWLPLWRRAASVHIGATDWLLDPDRLFVLAERYRSTFSWLPNFAFSYLAQRCRGRSAQYSLGHVRAWIDCSEPVRARSIDEFCGAFEPSDVRPAAIQASYAMAENVFAVTQSDLGAPLRRVPRDWLGPARIDAAEGVFVSSGRCLPDTDVKIVGEDGPVRERAIGEIHVRSQSLFDGYWGTDVCIPTSVADGWYATGDYGFVDAGELFVIGRLNDLVIVGGQNIYPEDVEAAVNDVSGVYAGRVVAFGVDDERQGTQSLAVVAEVRPDDVIDTNSVEDAIRRAVATNCGVSPRYVKVVPERWVVKSTAGKISRRETRARYLAEFGDGATARG